MNRRRLRRLLPTPADVRRRLGLGAGHGGGWRRGLDHLLHEPILWCPTRRSVSGGVAVGLFVAWMPVPLQMLLAAVLASVLRVHVPVSVVMVWFTNPLTIGPILYAAWWSGSILLGRTTASAPLDAALSDHAPSAVPGAGVPGIDVPGAALPDAYPPGDLSDSDEATLALLADTLATLPADSDTRDLTARQLLSGLDTLWPALLTGCLFLGTLCAVSGFVLTRLSWRALAVRRWRRRARRRRRQRAGRPTLS